MKREENRRSHPDTINAFMREMQAVTNCSKAISKVKDKCIKMKASKQT